VFEIPKKGQKRNKTILRETQNKLLQFFNHITHVITRFLKTSTTYLQQAYSHKENKAQCTKNTYST
jgi:hypothetical protein